MAVFSSAEKLKEILGGFFKELVELPEIKEKLIDSKLVIKFIYRNPDASITIDCTGDSIVLSFDDSEKKPIVEMSMDADVAHKFWMGNVNLVMALARRQMVAKGPIPKILKLLPVIKPAYKIYPEYLKKHPL